MDKECVALCAAINKLDGLETIESCSGHGESLFRIWFVAKHLEKLPVLLYYCDPCHVGFRWNCYATTDCGMAPVVFMLESESVGTEADEQAQRIAAEIETYL